MALSSSPSGSQPPVAPPERSRGSVAPDRLYIEVPGLDADRARQLAMVAAARAKAFAPKLSGQGAKHIDTYWGTGFFGVRWADPYMWLQETGSRPFTMRNLAGKVIPMWIDDPTGKMHADNPKAKTRLTANGRRQVLIFRKAAKIGARKNIRRGNQTVNVPQSFPGAPGRIAYREVTAYGGTGGRIAQMTPRSSPGVRWRHPGLLGRNFMHRALVSVAADIGIANPVVNATFRKR